MGNVAGKRRGFAIGLTGESRLPRWRCNDFSGPASSAAPPGRGQHLQWPQSSYGQLRLAIRSWLGDHLPWSTGPTSLLDQIQAAAASASDQESNAGEVIVFAAGK